jgi:hypothetical protein
LKPNNRPSRQMCADMTRSLASKPLHQGITGKHNLALAPETPRPSAAACGITPVGASFV